jgi:tRNA G18 (ribose-2'-O)-methylase SpoU
MEGTDYQTIEPSAIQLLVLGNEGKGISHQLEAELTQRIRIPKYGKAESLNVGIAGGILMNHMALSPNH